MYLTQYLAQAGICSRREAVNLIKNKRVVVNGVVHTDPSYMVQTSDQVVVDGKEVVLQPLRYILFHKPPHCVSTCSDPQGRPTVLDWIKTRERLYPIGRLDWDTTGVLLLTNDGQLAYRLSHPRFEVPKVYMVAVKRPFTQQALQELARGIMLEDGFIKPDAICFDVRTPLTITIEIHSGRNRVVRRLFAALGYPVAHLHRSAFAGLTANGLVAGAWRYLLPPEVRLLQKLISR